jgi:sugar/nucleoside kinase (ribokinase family)
MCDVYVYGMTVLSTIHQLNGPFPAADGYGDIEKTFVIPGGEGANAAIVLRALGVDQVVLDGCDLGYNTEATLQGYLAIRGIDCSKLQRRSGFPGWRDIVFCDGDNRTVFGWFGSYLFGDQRLWSEPCEESIKAARCVALDPFFGAESLKAAGLCAQHNTDYVTIDCKWDSVIAQSARVVVCSREFLDREYPDMPPEQTLTQYLAHCQGLIIFTFGSDSILYASSTTPVSRMQAYQVPVVDTLAAGDTFRAGAVYGVLRGFSEPEIVRFAAACAAVSVTRFPSVYEPPTLGEIMALMGNQPT